MCRRQIWWRIVALASGSAFFLEGCDPTLRGTVEDGIITTSTSLFGSFLRALIELGEEVQAEQTAQLITDVAQRFLA